MKDITYSCYFETYFNGKLYTRYPIFKSLEKNNAHDKMSEWLEYMSPEGDYDFIERDLRKGHYVVLLKNSKQIKIRQYLEMKKDEPEEPEEPEAIWWHIHVTMYKKTGKNIHLYRYSMRFYCQNYEESVREFNKTCDELKNTCTVIPLVDKKNIYNKFPIIFGSTNDNEFIAIVRLHPNVTLNDAEDVFQLYCDPSLDPQVL